MTLGEGGPPTFRSSRDPIFKRPLPEMHRPNQLRKGTGVSIESQAAKVNQAHRNQIPKETGDSTGSPAAPRLLETPLEVRQHIYELMLDAECKDHLNLLCVNKQIYREGKEYFFRRPLRCRSQVDLIHFVSSRPKTLLGGMVSLHLVLEELDSHVMQPFLASAVSGTPTQTELHPYLVEINRIKCALERLPGLTSLALLKSSSPNKNTPSSIVTTSTLNWAAEKYSNLRSMRIDIEACHLDSLAAFPELTTLRLTGFSETSSVRTAEVLGNLKNLEELHVVGPPQGLQIRQRHGHQIRIVQSVTHQVFERLNPLKRLTLIEVAEPRTEAGIFLSSKMLKALFDVHRESLRMLKISTSATPKPSFVAFLSAFLMATPSMQDLSLTWHNMEVEFVDCFPASIRRLELAVASQVAAQAIVDRLISISYRLRYLRRIKFCIINQVTEASVEGGKEGPLVFSLPIQGLAV